jgi:hypothetical protein
VSISIGALLGNLEGGSSTGDFERWLMLRKALDTGISLHKGPVGEPGGDSLAGTFDRKGQYI